MPEAALNVVLLRHTPEPEEVVAMAAKLCYSPSGVEDLKQKIEATVHVRGKDIFAESEDQNMYAAIDGLVDKLDRAVIRHKEKQQDRRGATPVPADDE